MDIIDWIKGWNRKRVTRLRLRQAGRQTPFGFTLNAIPAMQDGSFEPEETALVRTLLTRSDRFVNVGANMGFYCLLAARQGVETLAFEPVPTNVQFIAQNIRENAASGVTVLPVAAGEEAGFVDIFGVGTGSSVLPSWGNNPRSTRQTVPVVRMDDVVRMPKGGERLMILMDIEGYEYFALKGASGLIGAATKPVWIIEVVGDGFGTTRNPDAEKVFRLMEGAGYSAVRADRTMAPANGPSPDCTNFVFYDSRLSTDEIFGPPESRVKPIFG